MRGQRIIRYHRIMQMLERPQGATVPEIARDLKIHRATVYRYIDMLEREGHAPYPDDPLLLEREKRWKLPPPPGGRSRIPPLRISRSELVALEFIRGYARLYRGTSIEEDVENVFQKIEASLSGKALERIKRVRSIFIPTIKFAKDYSGKEISDVIDDLTDAMLNLQVCRVSYYSFADERIKEHELEPLHFFEHHGGLYIFARIRPYEDIRMLALERIRKVLVMEETFAYPEGFDPEKRLEEAFTIFEDEPVDVAIRFAESQAKYVRERTWAKGQKIRENKDGSIVLEMSTSGRWDVMRWVLGFGEEAEILRPLDMRAEIKDRLNQAAKLYAPK